MYDYCVCLFSAHPPPRATLSNSDEEATVLSYTHSSMFSESDCFRFELQRPVKFKIKIRRADSAGGSIDGAASALCRVEEPDEGSDPTVPVPVNGAGVENVIPRIS